jgi:mono/diheme cytochrome c family protein
MTFASTKRPKTAVLGRWAIALPLLVVGCQQEMADQPSYKPLQPCDFFGDGRSARPLVDGTIARGHLQLDPGFFIGRSAESGAADGSEAPATAETGSQTPAATENSAAGFDEDRQFVTELPIPVTEPVLRHGYNRYMIYCVVCHDPLGTGRGKIVERGYTTPPSFHIDRLRTSPVGRLFAVVSEGYGSMPAYGTQIPTADRWAIVAYVRALQLSQHFPKQDLSPDMEAGLAKESDLSAPLEELLPSKEALR